MEMPAVNDRGLDESLTQFRYFICIETARKRECTLRLASSLNGESLFAVYYENETKML